MSRNLSGVWVGQYRYPDGGLDFPVAENSVSFQASIRDVGGAFTGQVTEEGGPPSTLRGTREGTAVTFSKRYAHSGGGLFTDRVVYSGDLNEDATRIDGEWNILRLNHVPGAFFMMREAPLQKEVVGETEVEVL